MPGPVALQWGSGNSAAVAVAQQACQYTHTVAYAYVISAHVHQGSHMPVAALARECKAARIQQAVNPRQVPNCHLMLKPTMRALSSQAVH